MCDKINMTLSSHAVLESIPFDCRRILNSLMLLKKKKIKKSVSKFSDGVNLAIA